MFIRVCVGSFERALGTSDVSRGFSQRRLQFALFIGVLVGSVWRAKCCRRRHWGSPGFTVEVYGSIGSLGFAWVYSGASRGRRVHSGSRGFTRAGIGVTELIRFRVDSLGRA